MSMLHPSQKDQLKNLFEAGYKEVKEESPLEKITDFNQHQKDERRNSQDMKDFYDERPNNAIFLETSKE